MIEEGIAKDLSMVVENAKLMGCQEVKSFRHIPLKMLRLSYQLYRNR
ncbi:MAG: hypothetical protein ACLSAC_13735 [Enterocloster bolteae]